MTFANKVVTIYRRLDMVEELEKMANLNIPKDFSSDEANKYLVDTCAKLEIKCPPPHTAARLLDKVCLCLSPFSLNICYVNRGTLWAFHLAITNELYAIWRGTHHLMSLFEGVPGSKC